MQSNGNAPYWFKGEYKPDAYLTFNINESMYSGVSASVHQKEGWTFRIGYQRPELAGNAEFPH